MEKILPVELVILIGVYGNIPPSILMSEYTPFDKNLATNLNFDISPLNKNKKLKYDFSKTKLMIVFIEKTIFNKWCYINQLGNITHQPVLTWRNVIVKKWQVYNYCNRDGYHCDDYERYGNCHHNIFEWGPPEYRDVIVFKNQEPISRSYIWYMDEFRSRQNTTGNMLFKK